MVNESKPILQRGSKAFVISGFNVITGVFISESNDWSYVENESGAVIGYKKSNVFAIKEEALENLVDVLKSNLYYYIKELVEKLKGFGVLKLDELVAVIEESNKILKKKNDSN